MDIQMKIQCLYTHADARICNNMLSGTYLVTIFWGGDGNMTNAGVCVACMA